MATIKDYFDFCAQDTWKCSVCEKEVKAKTTSNLLQHFRHHHPNTYEEYVEVAKRRPSATHARAVVSSKKPRKIHIIKHDDPTVSSLLITPAVQILVYVVSSVMCPRRLNLPKVTNQRGNYKNNYLSCYTTIFQAAGFLQFGGMLTFHMSPEIGHSPARGEFPNYPVALTYQTHKIIGVLPTVRLVDTDAWHIDSVIAQSGSPRKKYQLLFWKTGMTNDY